MIGRFVHPSRKCRDFYKLVYDVRILSAGGLGRGYARTIGLGLVFSFVSEFQFRGNSYLDTFDLLEKTYWCDT